METYTHNLQIFLFDKKGNVVIDNDYLEQIKNTLCTIHTKEVKWNTKNIQATIWWNKKNLNNIDKYFMGDLFLNSIYDQDSIIIDHTKQIISCVENRKNYDIRFYITRLVGDKSPLIESFGTA